MSENSKHSNRQWFRLWSIPVFISAGHFLFKAWHSGAAEHWLFGTGLLLCGAFALRHNLFDHSADTADPRKLGKASIAVLGGSVMLVVAAAFAGMNA